MAPSPTPNKHLHMRWAVVLLFPCCLTGAVHPVARNLLDNVPLRFEANRGQEDARVQFVSSGPGYTLLLTEEGSVLRLRQGKRVTSVAATLRHAGRGIVLEGLEPLPTSVNYFRGNRASQWITGVPSYARVQYRSVYPGIDLVFYGTGRNLEYDFVVAPGADPAAIEMEMFGTARLRLDANDDLAIATGAGEVRWRKPTVYQIVDGRRSVVQAHFSLRGKNLVGFEIASYDRSRSLVVDPTLSYSTYLGGSDNDLASRIAVDNAGNIYVAGATSSVNLPFTAGSLQPAFKGGSAGFTTTGDAFVAKIDASGTKAIYVTYLGGTADDIGLGIAVDSSGSAYVTGYTNSADFPTRNAFQSSFAGPTPASLTISGVNFFHPGGDAFLMKLNPTGNAIVYSTYFGGSSHDRGTAIAVDSANNAYVAGITLSTNFPFSANAYQKTMKGGGGSPQFCANCGINFTAGDAFVAKFNADGSRAWATLLGGSLDELPTSIIAAPDGSVWLGGSTLSTDFPTSVGAYQRTYGGTTNQAIQNIGDGFISRISADGASLLYSTYLGGSGDDMITGMAMDSSAALYVTGFTSSANFPHTTGTYHGPTSRAARRTFLVGDAFVAKFNFFAANPLVFSTFLGSTDDEGATAIALDGPGNIYVTGYTGSRDFPLVDPFQSRFGGVAGGDVQRNGHAFLTQLNPAGTQILYSTLLGGSQNEIATGLAIDTAGNVYVGGVTSSPDFPIQGTPLQRTLGGAKDANGLTGDTFIAKFTGFAVAAAALKLSAAVSSASVAAGADFTYTFTANNPGPVAATNLKLAATFTGGAVQITGVSISAGSCSDLTAATSTVTCSTASLALNASAVVTIRGSARQVGVAQAGASLTWDNGAQQSAQVTVTVVPPPGALKFALPVMKAAAGTAPVAVALAAPNIFLLTNSVEIYQNNPSAQARINLTPQPSVALPGGSSPVAMLTLDLNGDQLADLVILDKSAGAVTTFLASGSDYSLAQSIATNANPAAMASLNLNGDANRDLVVTGDNGVTLFTSNGDGTFTEGATIDVAGRQGNLVAVAAGSFTGAGADDVVLADEGGNIWLLPSDGNGGFRDPTMAQAGASPSALVVGDFNGDQLLDVAVANSGSGNVSLLLGDGAGNLGPAANFITGAGPQALAAADFDGDGKLDLAVAVAGLNTICLLRGDGAGSFQAPLQYLVGTTPIALAVGDIDGDGKPDIVVANRQSRDLSVLLNQN